MNKKNIKKRLLSETFCLKLNNRLMKMMPSRVEYGLKDGLHIDFEVTTPGGGYRLVTEQAFRRWKGKRAIGIWNVGAGTAMVLYAAEIMYPDATIMVKRDPAS